jgi:hypothetical protein
VLEVRERPAEAGLFINGCYVLSSRIQRNSKAERLLTCCTLSPLKCPSDLRGRGFLPSKTFKFANVCFGSFASFCFPSHIKSNLFRDGNFQHNPTA